MNDRKKQYALHQSLLAFSPAVQWEVRRLFGAVWKQWESRAICPPEHWNAQDWIDDMQRAGYGAVTGDDCEQMEIVRKVAKFIFEARG